MTKEILENLKNLEDEDLTEILFTEKDTLPRAVVDEFVFRGKRMLFFLWEIIRETNCWQGDDSEWWAVIHASFITGAIGGREAVAPLLMSLRFSDAYDCDWVFEALPSIFGKIGPVALEPLKKIALDMSNSWFVKVIALESMAAITVTHRHLTQEVFDFIAQISKDPYEERMTRGTAGSILLDFRQRKYEKTLLEFAQEEEEMREKMGTYYIMHFDRDSVLEILNSAPERPIPQQMFYTRDWLDFYNKKEIASRQKRWKKENSLWGKLESKWYKWFRLWYRLKWKWRGKKELANSN